MTDANQSPATERLPVAGIELETIRRGSLHPIVVLHGMQNLDPGSRFVDLLARKAEIIAPSHPGFGNSPRPDGFETVYDLVHLYLELIDSLPYDKVTLLGLSFGGWLAAEIAAKSCHRLDRLILVDSVGIKVSDRETPDVFDVFNRHPDEVRARSWHDPAAAPDYNVMTDEALVVRAKNWDALCLYGWHPYMYNPRLAHWLQRIKVPSLVLWGASDGIVKPSYGEAFSRLIPGARFAPIAAAGHHPEIEQPEALVDHIAAFLPR